MATSATKKSQPLTTPLQFLKGVGPERADLLAKLGLKTARDAIFFFPRTYEDLSQMSAIADLQEGSSVSVEAKVEEVELRSTGVGRSVLGVLFFDGCDYLRATWFNQPYLRDKFQVGQRVLVSGTPKRRGMRWEMTHPKIQWLDDEDATPQSRLLPIYSLTEGVKQAQMRRLISGAVEGFAEAVDEPFTAEFLADRELPRIDEALRQIHQPTDHAMLALAQRRLIYQELLVLQLAVALRKWQSRNEYHAPSLPCSAKVDARIRRLFPFELTTDQSAAIAEITSDLARTEPMNRLLQGDVGSGKTVVAEYAMLVAVANGYQAAMMAPTEILARQHVRTLSRDLEQSRVRIALLTGSISAAQRRATLAEIRAGDVDLIVGTHAVLNDAVEFPKLGLVVVDEQHRFGVRQRAALRDAGMAPHSLVMTATPIPRTVAMTLFGDLDVSNLQTPPSGRQPVHTYTDQDDQREQWWDFFRKKLLEGRQGYVIAPLVDEGEAQETESAERLYETLSNGELEAFRVDLLHGRMSTEEKEVAMEKFHRRETQVLVATAVVEVGIDVPNATVMTIESGERFGLASLHQLRGRISRGSHPGFLCVFADAKTTEAQERLEAFAKTTNGFELAEIDFQLRGPGELFGTKQHGLPPFLIANLQRDTEVLEQARADARAILEVDPGLKQPTHAMLLRKSTALYGKAFDLGDVG